MEQMSFWLLVAVIVAQMGLLYRAMVASERALGRVASLAEKFASAIEDYDLVSTATELGGNENPVAMGAEILRLARQKNEPPVPPPAPRLRFPDAEPAGLHL